MMRFGIDLDGVCYMWEKTARYMLRHILPDSPYTRDGPLGQESTHWGYIEENVSSAHWNWLWHEGIDLGLLRHGHMYTGTIEAIRELSTMGEVIIITHRGKRSVPDTLAWLAYQRLPVAGIHILTNQEPKSSVQKCDVYLDDKFENCVDLTQTGGRVYMMDRPWNRDRYYKNRVFDWPDFIEKVRVGG